MLGAEALAGEERERRLVEALLDESDGEGAERLLVPRRQRGDGGRVDPAGEENADGHIGDQPPRDGRVETFHETAARLVHAAVEALRGGKLPVAPQPETRLVEDGQMRGGELEDVAMDAARRGDVFDCEVLGERLRIELTGDAAVGNQRLQLAPEHAAGGTAAGFG